MKWHSSGPSVVGIGFPRSKLEVPVREWCGVGGVRKIPSYPNKNGRPSPRMCVTYLFVAIQSSERLAHSQRINALHPPQRIHKLYEPPGGAVRDDKCDLGSCQLLPAGFDLCDFSRSPPLLLYCSGD